MNKNAVNRRTLCLSLGAASLSGCTGHGLSFEDWCVHERVAACAPTTPQGTDATDRSPSNPVRDGIGVAFSGGGYKAGLFHLGGIIRLNETGILSHADRISSVSGGSITTAYLGMKWDRLTFDRNGSATNLLSEVVSPLLDFYTSHTLDVSSTIGGFLPGRTASSVLASQYDRLLYGSDLARGEKRTLQDLPDRKHAPHFVINATSLQLNTLWRFSRARAANHLIGVLNEPEFSLGTVVAASSAFPPFFSPLYLDLPRDGWDNRRNGPFRFTDYGKRAALGDGGIYDNLGAETIFKRYQTLILSNAGAPFALDPNPRRNWFSQLRRTISQIHKQAEYNRKRWMFDLKKAGRLDAYVIWEINHHASQFRPADLPALSPEDAYRAATFPVRLKRVSHDNAQLLLHHGYSLAAHALAAHFPGGTSASAAFPSVVNAR